MTRPVATALLLVCTALWGFAFVAQKTAMDSMGPLTFAGIRFLLGGAVVAPLAAWEWRRAKARGTLRVDRRDQVAIAAVCLSLFIENWLIQAGLAITTVTNGGFLVSLYVLFVPLLTVAIYRTRPHPVLFAAVPLALVGLYLLNGARLEAFNRGDALVVAGAVFVAVQVLALGEAAKRTGLPILISALSFLVCGALSVACALVLERPGFSGIGDGWVQILYAGILSTAVAFTLQAVGQQQVPPANAAVVLSAESLFAAAGGALFLGDRLDLGGYVGAAVVFAAIVMAEAAPHLSPRRLPVAITGQGS